MSAVNYVAWPTYLAALIVVAEAAIILLPEAMLRRAGASVAPETRKDTIRWELWRKTAHVLTGLLFALLPVIGVTVTDYFVVTLVLICFPLLRNRLGVLSRRPGVWKTWSLIALLGVPYAFDNILFYQAAFLTYAIPDALASVIGKTMGTPRRILNGKSSEGTAAYVISECAILAAMGIGLGWSLFVAGIAAFLEVVSVKGYDNLWCPLAVGLLVAGSPFG
jgi:dolichol kinase